MRYGLLPAGYRKLRGRVGPLYRDVNVFICCNRLVVFGYYPFRLIDWGMLSLVRSEACHLLTILPLVSHDNPLQIGWSIL